MSYKSSIAADEKLKKERKAGIASLFKTGKLPSSSSDDDDDEDMSDNTGLINSDATGAKSAYEGDDDDDEQVEETQLRQKIADDDDDEEDTPEPVKAAKEPEKEDDELTAEKYNKQLREENAQLRAQFEQDKIERQQFMQEMRQAKQPAQQPAFEADPDVPWVEKPQLDQFRQQLDHQNAQVQAMLLKQERAIFERDMAELKKEFATFSQTYSDSQLENMWQTFARNPAAFKNANAPSGLGQNWKGEVLAAFKQRDYDRLAAIKQEAKSKADELDKKRREKAAENSKNLGKVPRSGTAYQEPAQKVLPRARRDMKSLRGDMLRHIAQGG